MFLYDVYVYECYLMLKFMLNESFNLYLFDNGNIQRFISYVGVLKVSELRFS